MNPDTFLGHLHHVQKSGDGWMALCPAHEDKHNSLSIGVGDGGKILLTCHAGCPAKEVVGALGLQLRDLFPEEKRPARKQVVARYNYLDEHGEVLFQVERLEPKGFRQRRPDGRGGWKYNLNGVRRVLYQLPSLLAEPERLVFVVEGEKDTDRLREFGFLSTCNSCGAGSWRAEYSAHLKGRPIVILPDNDPPDKKTGRRPGLDHALQVARSLHEVAASVKVVQLPKLPEHGDVSDWLDNGGTAEQLKALVREAQEWDPTHETKSEFWERGETGFEDFESFEEWEPPIPFHVIKVPAFPTATFPGWLQDFVEAVAEATQTPADLPGMLSLAALATACGGRFEVEVQPGYKEPLNVFVAVAMPPASLKSAVFKKVAAPVERWERNLAQELAPQINEEQIARAIKEKRLDTIKQKAAKERDSDDREALTQEAADLAEELRLQVVTTAPRLLADDCTPEALASLLADHEGRMAVLSPEGGLFDMIAGRYTDSKLNMDVYLKGHAGDSIRVDRKGRASEFVESPALTVGLAVQPSVIQELGDRGVFRGRGLLARFFYSLPTSTVGHRQVDPAPVPMDIREAYHSRFRHLLEMELESEGPTILRLAPEALAVWLDFRRWLEPQLAESGALGPLADWAGKLHGAVARIAGLLHAAESQTDIITADTMTRAVELGHYLIPHAQAAFAMMDADSEVEKAKRVLPSPPVRI